MKNFVLILAVLLAACSQEASQKASQDPVQPEGEMAQAEEAVVESTPVIRIAVFNTSLYRDETGALIADLSQTGNPQIEAVASIIRAVNPDILVLNEFDYDKEGAALKAFQENYLFADDPENQYPYGAVFPSNTGIASGVDFNNDGAVVTMPGSRDYGGDAFGYGIHEGQYAFAVLSRFPLDEANMRSFQKFLWADMPDNLMPLEWYSQEAQEIFRLSSKNHVDLPVMIDGAKVHLLISHPTPPSFDGPEDRNGRRNHDEIRLWADYIDPERGGYLMDDKGEKASLEAGARFVILGDLNSDPNDGESYDHAIRQLVDNPLVVDSLPQSLGGIEAAKRQGGVNADHKGLPENDTADFRDEGNGAIGNLRLDYALPSKAGIKLISAGVFWPGEKDAAYDLVGPGFPPVSSDHRLVWIDIEIEE